VEEDTIAGSALAPGEKPAQILICRKRKKPSQEVLVLLVEFAGMGFSTPTFNHCGFDCHAACCVLVH
jgi:hypothetical protein